MRWPRGRRGQPSLTARVTLPPVGANEDARALIIEVGGRCRGSSASKLLCGDNSHHSALCVENGHGRDGLVARRKPNSLRESVHALLTPIAAHWIPRHTWMRPAAESLPSGATPTADQAESSGKLLQTVRALTATPEIRASTMVADHCRLSRRRWFVLDGNDASRSGRPGCRCQQGGRAAHADSLVVRGSETEAVQTPVEGATAEAKRSRGLRLVALCAPHGVRDCLLLDFNEPLGRWSGAGCDRRA